MRMRCVCKSWKSIISDPKFIKLHLKRSARNPYLTLSRRNMAAEVVPFPVRCLIEKNPLILLAEDLSYQFGDKDCRYAIGSCNGLFCLLGYTFNFYVSEPGEFWFRFWNPIMGTMSQKLGHFFKIDTEIYKSCKFAFLYDDSSETYKVVLLKLDVVENKTHVRVFSVADNAWKTIPNFPAVPLPNRYTDQGGSHGVYLNGSLNWLAIQDRPVSVYGWENIKSKEFVIVSLDMGTKSHTQLMPPSGFDETSSVKPPSVCIFKDSLCFSHDYRRTEFVIWQMKIIGVEEPWTQLLKISYQNLQTRYHDFADLKNFQLLPLHLSDHSDTLNLQVEEILNLIKKIRVLSFLNWGRNFTSIYGRNFGDFELYVRNYNIRVPNLYIWGRNSP
ncbi:F-box protein interaction domain protein [Medicago truncatula]|uniref:F-box protein interaction domain protein n=1 Tax=Medicago truncatula TaxID=3880 RepID=G7IK29_MEDTR|nr:F-box protein interaction domain protein [Medicago truncatula]